MKTATRYRVGSACVVLLLILLWQVAAWTNHSEISPGRPFVPGWDVIVTQTLLGLSDYWGGSFGPTAVDAGGERTYVGAFLAIGANALDTMARLFAGFGVGAVVGTLVALLVSGSVWGRRLLSLPTQVLRTFPLLALVPLFQLWFGLSFGGAVTFVGIAVGVIFFTGVVNAVGNVPTIYLDNARTLGAGRIRVYRTVVLPGILPELQTTFMLALGAAWTAVVGAEFVGAETGLGRIIVFAKYFGYVDRMLLVGIVLLVLAAASMALANRLTRPLTAWQPEQK